MKIFMLSVLLGLTLLIPNATFVADPRAQAVLDAARTAIGGDELQKLQGVTINGHYRRVLGDRQLEGDREVNIELPDKYLIEDAMNPGGMSTALITARGLNGEHAWNASSGGGGGMFIRMGPGGPEVSPEQMEAMMRRQCQIEMTRYLLALIATPPGAMALESKYAGESDVEGSPADVVEFSRDKFSLRVFFDKQSHLPLLLNYRGPKPRIMTMTRTTGGSEEAIKKAREEAERKMAGGQGVKPDEVDFFIRLSGHKKVNNLVLPHKFTFLTESEVSEEFEISKYKINPQFKADKFQKH